jgi:hypothetical protein
MSADHLHALTEPHLCFSGCVSGLPHTVGFVVERVKPNDLPLLSCARVLSEQQDIEVIRGVAAFDGASEHLGLLHQVALALAPWCGDDALDGYQPPGDLSRVAQGGFNFHVRPTSAGVGVVSL